MHSVIEQLRAQAAAELAGEPPPEIEAEHADGTPGPTRCKEFDAGWLDLARQGLSMATVLASPLVDDATFGARMEACGDCPHSTRKMDELYCACCRCPNWSIAKLRVKNRHSGHKCPRKPPAF